jgi:hypothetical protein
MAKSKQPEKPQFVYKSAKSGEFVTKKFAEDHPSTTFKEKIHKSK